MLPPRNLPRRRRNQRRRAAVARSSPLDPTLPGGSRRGEPLELLGQLWATHHQLQCISRSMERHRGITGPQRIVVKFVANYPGITAGQIAELLQLNPSTLTGILKRLVAGALLERRRDPDDYRRAQFFLTQRGRDVDLDATGTAEAAVQRVFTRLEPGRARIATEILAEITEELARELAAAEASGYR